MHTAPPSIPAPSGLRKPVHARRSHSSLSLLILAGAVACTDEVPDLEVSTPPEVTVIADTPIPQTLELSAPVPLDGDVTDMASVDGTVYVATTTGLFSLEAGVPTAVPLLATDDSPSETGGIIALGRRSEGLLVAAETGIYYLFSGSLVYSPVSETTDPAEVSGLGATGEGEGEQVWLNTTSGLLQVTDEFVLRVSVPTMSGLPQVLGTGDALVLLAYQDGLIELNPQSLTASPGALVTDVNDIYPSGNGFWLSTEAGLVERSTAGTYTRYAFTHDAAGVPTFGMALDYSGIPHAASRDGLLRLESTGIKRYAWPSGFVGSQVAVDAGGDVWVGGGNAVLRYAVGTPIGFASTIAPIFSASCNGCHLNGAAAPAHDFTDYDEVMAILDATLERIYTGNMPPNGPLEDYEYEAISLWSQNGTQP